MRNLTIALLTSTALLAVPAFAKTKRVTVVKPTSTTVVEQHPDGKVTTITSTPDGFTIRDGMPFVPTSVIVTPTYSRLVAPTVTTTTVTPAAPNTILNTVDANGVPTTTVIKPTAIVSTTTTPSITPVVPLVTTPVITTPTIVVTP